jgi:hypothetical protein
MLVNYTLEPIEINGIVYDQRHGGPFDRGAADSYYNRPRSPHYYVGDTYNSPKVLLVPSDPAFEEYMAGYDYNEQHGDKKNWC